jgi:hypothetical protein
MIKEDKYQQLIKESKKRHRRDRAIEQIQERKRPEINDLINKEELIKTIHSLQRKINKLENDLNEIKAVRIPFGKYKGRKLHTTIRRDAEYFDWLYSREDDNSFREVYKIFYRALDKIKKQ